MSETVNENEIKSSSQFKKTPRGWAKLWAREMKAAERNQEEFVKAGNEVISEFLDERPDGQDSETHVNLFSANIQTTEAMLYGKVPQADVSRRHGDPGNGAARAAGEALRRMLNLDLERGSDGFTEALRLAIMDRLLPGLGNIRLRYVADFRKVPAKPAITRPKVDPATGTPMVDEEGEPVIETLAEAVPETEEKVYEAVECDHAHWEDQRWSPARTFNEVRWWSFKAAMTLEEMENRFGAKIAKKIPLNTKDRKDGADSGLENDPWSRADVWEIWDKDRRKVFWWVEGHSEILDEKDDPLGLEGFFPFPKPLMANLTTKKLIPRADWVLAQDLYRRVNKLSTRISRLQDALKVRGLYNAAAKEIKGLADAPDNTLIEVENWAMWGEKGGIQGQIDWFPLEMVINTLDKLREQRAEVITLLYQVTGMSDIMRGQSGAQATATEQAIKAKFASVRMTRFQDDVARFAGEAQAIKAEIIAKHFSPDTIIAQSNIMYTADAPLAQQAVELIKSDFLLYQIKVQPESISLTDYAALKQERVELMQALAQLLQVVMPLGQAAPTMLPPMLSLIKWMLAGFKGSSTAEGILDQATTEATKLVQMALQKATQPPPPDPKQKTEEVKAAGAIEKTKLDMKKAQMEFAIDTQRLQHEQSAAQADHVRAMQEQEAGIRRDAMASVNQTVPGGDK